MSDFDGYGFVAGSVNGIRSWRVDQLGRLTGVTVREVWRPGVNAAECHKDTMRSGNPFVRLGALQAGGYISSPYRLTLHASAGDAIAEPAPPQEHDPSSCTCGFYAYFADQHNPYHEEGGLVRGVVRAYGKTTLGDKGFRAQQSEIVALCFEQAPATRTPVARGHIVPSWSTRNWWAALGLNLAVVATQVLAAIATGGMSGLGVFLVAVNLLCAVAWAAKLRDIANARHALQAKCNYPALHRTGTCRLLGKRSQRVRVAVRHNRAIEDDAQNPWTETTAAKLSDELLDRVRRNYSGVPIYTDLASMLAAHPLDASPVTEFTPDTDPDFWTRKAVAS